MDEAAKLQKLAAGRKKLKNHQKKKKALIKTEEDSKEEELQQQKPVNSIEQAPEVEEVKLLDKQPDTDNIDDGNTQYVEANSNVIIDNSLQTYFTTHNLDNNGMSFFDNISQLPLPPAVVNQEAKPFQIEIKPEIDVKLEHDVGNVSPVDLLRSLTSQMAQTIDYDTTEFENIAQATSNQQGDDFHELYNMEKMKNQQLEQELQAIKQQLGETINNLQVEFNEKLISLDTQLQTHIQTIGILVGEKTELNAALNQSETINKQKIGECSELQARLKTSRSRVYDLEKELCHLKEEHAHCSRMLGESEVLQRRLAEQHDDYKIMQQDIIELQEKLKLKTNECLSLHDHKNQLKSQLDLAEIKIQQLSDGSLDDGQSGGEKLMQEKLALEKDVNDYKVKYEAMLNERDRANNQYQQYVQQLNSNITSLAQKLEVTLQENESLAKRESDFIKHVGELEKRLQHLQEHHVENTTMVEHEANVNNNTEFVELKVDLALMREKYDGVCAELDELLKDNAVKKQQIAEFELDIEKFKFHQADNSQLLAAIESDKVAAARAVEQNRQLKSQLEEMQKAFIKMTNDKAELADKLTTQEYMLNESVETQQQTQQQLNKMIEAISIKDNELIHLRHEYEQLQAAHVHDHQLNDRLRHYEAVEHSSKVLQHQMNSSDERVGELEAELAKLLLENQALQQKLNVPPASEDGSFVVVEATTQQQQQNHVSINNNNNIINEDDSQQQQDEINHHCNLTAMQQLESKFLKTMQEIANLQEEKQMLEHLVMQLQSETETIGEYVALYQHQRGILQQRAHEKELQLKQLADDRMQVKSQLTLLNDLIEKLMKEKAAGGGELHDVPEKLLEKTNELCENHNQQTAEQIMALLTEIKTSNLVQPSNVPETTFHPCPLCSGQLITV